jgi:hypothetical protein
VLVVGGSSNGADLASAEIYHPEADAFFVTGSMSSARSFHTATLLCDGTVLVVGGSSNGVGLASAEVYDPRTGAFVAAGSMATARAGHTATLLDDGTVLIVGGGYASAEIYDPETGSFFPTDSMATSRSLHTATLLFDGTVLVVGGAPGPEQNRQIVEVYDPATGTFSETGRLNVPGGRNEHTATLLPDGTVLVAGGDNFLSAPDGLSSAQIYEPATGTFSFTSGMATRRGFHHAASILPDGTVLVVGGIAKLPAPSLASAEIYDSQLGTFSPTGSMVTARAGHTATLLDDGTVLIVGGHDFGNYFASAEIYDPQTATWR